MAINSKNSKIQKSRTNNMKQFMHQSIVLTLAICFVTLFTECTHALFDGTDNVETFSSRSDFRSKVLESDSLWLIMFYAPWCGHCKQYQPTYSALADILKGVVSVGAVDAASDSSQKGIASQYSVTGYPTMKLFGLDSKSNPVDLQTRNPEELLNTIMKEIQTTFQNRANKGSKSKQSGSSGSGSYGKNENSKVIQLNSSNFQSEVYDNPDVVLVAFVAPWCGHCKALLPEWDEASKKLHHSGAILGVVDATEETSLAAEYRIEGYPTIKVFPGGSGKSKSSAMEYNGGRQSAQIVQYALDEVDRSGVPKEIPELLNDSMIRETCSGSSSKNDICVFFALPHILDSGAEGRNKYKSIIMNASKAVRGMSFHFFWFEGTSQPELENALELTFGFPEAAALSMEKGVYAVHRASFSESNLRNFLLGITTRKQAVHKLNQFPVIQTVEPWDGMDAVPYEDEPLEDIMGWNGDDEL